MSSIIAGILSTTNALKANQAAIEVAGRNMANVNNPNYSRQRVEFGLSGGISQSTVSRIIDDIVNSKIITESSVSGSLEAQNRILQQLQVTLGEQINGDVSEIDTLDGSTPADLSSGGLSSALTDFFNAIQAFSVKPDDAAAKASVIAHGEELVSKLNTIATDLEKLDEDTVTNIEGDVSKANKLLNEIASLNGEVSRVEISNPGAAYELRDLRQQKLTELAKYISFEQRDLEHGQIQIVAKDKTNTGGRDIVLVDNTEVKNSLRFNEPSNEVYFSNYTTKPLGNSPNATAMQLTGGSLHGYTHVRSMTDPYGGTTSFAVGPLAKMREDLDLLAREIATKVSGVYDDTTNPAAPQIFFDDDANPDAIDLNNVTAKNIRLYQGDPTDAFGGGAIDPLSVDTLKATDTNQAGANEVAVALAELAKSESGTLRGNTFTGFVAEMATNIGNDVANNKDLIVNQKLIESQLESQKASVSGVSVDEELANMIRFQRSFEASARVLKVMDEILNTIVNGLVR